MIFSRKIKTASGKEILCHTYIGVYPSGGEYGDKKDFDFELGNIASKKKKSLQADVLKLASNECYDIHYRDEDSFKAHNESKCLFSKRTKIQLNVNEYENKYWSDLCEYNFHNKLREFLPENYKFIELEDRQKTLEVLYPTGVDNIVPSANRVLSNDNFTLSDTKLDFNQKLLHRDVFDGFDGSKFLQLFVMGHLLDTLGNNGIEEIHILCDYTNVIVYYDGISKKFLSDFLKDVVEKFNHEFSAKTIQYGVGTKTIKYVPCEEAFTEDLFGNKIGIGDLVISPQTSRYGSGGSWADMFIVRGVNGGRLVPDKKNREWYIANRCILLRSNNGVSPKFGDKDFQEETNAEN